jgi:hypothetical protein
MGAISSAKALSNARIGRKSSGAKTAAGKLTIARANTTNGIYSKLPVLAGVEDPVECEKFHQGFTAAWQPVGTHEAECVRHLAHCYWRLRQLCGQEKAREAQIQVGGQTMCLSRLYAELERLTGDPACWGTVQTLMLRAGKREGIQPLTGMPLPTRFSYRAAFPWFGEDSDLRREMKQLGSWGG